jgi:hypothetical protein
VRSFTSNRVAYARHIFALITPGNPPPTLRGDRTTPGDLSGWTTDDLNLLIEEGRRHIDRVLADIDRVRNRAQQTFTAALALLVVVAAQLPTVTRHNRPIFYAIFALSALFVTIGLVGALSVFVVQVKVSIIHAGVLSRYQPPIRKALADDYATVTGESENTSLTLVTVLREALLYVSIGAALDGILWLSIHV